MNNYYVIFVYTISRYINYISVGNVPSDAGIACGLALEWNGNVLRILFYDAK